MINSRELREFGTSTLLPEMKTMMRNMGTCKAGGHCNRCGREVGPLTEFEADSVLGLSNVPVALCLICLYDLILVQGQQPADAPRFPLPPSP